MLSTIFIAILALYVIFVLISFYKNEKKYNLNRGLYRRVLYSFVVISALINYSLNGNWLESLPILLVGLIIDFGVIVTPDVNDIARSVSRAIGFIRKGLSSNSKGSPTEMAPSEKSPKL